MEDSVAEKPAEELVKAETPLKKVVSETPAQETPTSEDSANTEDNKKKED